MRLGCGVFDAAHALRDYTDRGAVVSLGRGHETLKVIVERDLVQSEQLLLSLRQPTQQLTHCNVVSDDYRQPPSAP